MIDSIPIAILTGGHSTRMGQPKHSLNYGSGVHWRRLLTELQPGNKVYFAIRNEQVTQFWGHRYIVDKYADCGPMGAILGLLESLDCDVCVAGCDMPMLKREHFDVLRAAHGQSGALITCATSGEGSKPEPMFSAWSPRIRTSLQKALQAGEYGLRRFLSAREVSCVNFAPYVVANINSPGDMALLKPDGQFYVSGNSEVK
ncbi:MAG: hypothetical protein Kow0075_17370 [Salibacteraceae bacterium]